VAVLAAILVVTGALGALIAGESEKSIRIIYTTDTNGYLEPCG